MHKIYSKSREEDYEIVVDWNLGNICSFKCSYCSPGFHAGYNPFPDIQNAKNFIDAFASKRKGDNRSVKFSFVGGEPTEYDGLEELCSHIKSKMFAKIHIMTNGAKDITYWKSISKRIDSVAISYHPSKIDAKHYEDVATLLHSLGISVKCIFPMHTDTFDVSMDVVTAFAKKGLKTQLQPLYVDHARRSKLIDYSSGQLDILFPKNQTSDLVIETETETKSIGSTDQIIHTKQNSFIGMKCGIGIDQIVIDQGGYIRGGWCGVGGILGSVNEGTFNLPTDAFTCTKQTCSNPLDLTVPKWIEE